MEENENPQSRELVRKTGILFETLGACRKQVSFTITANDTVNPRRPLEEDTYHECPRNSKSCFANFL